MARETRDKSPETEGDSYYQEVLARLHAGLIECNTLISSQLSCMLTNKDVCYSEEEVKALRTARRKFVLLSENVKKTLNISSSINAKIVRGYVDSAGEIHKKYLEEPAKKYTR